MTVVSNGLRFVQSNKRTRALNQRAIDSIPITLIKRQRAKLTFFKKNVTPVNEQSFAQWKQDKAEARRQENAEKVCVWVYGCSGPLCGGVREYVYVFVPAVLCMLTV